MRCAQCQADNREGRRFCGECGAALALVCAGCGFSNAGGEKFCGGCGSPLGAMPAPSAAAPPPEPTLRSPQTYTPKHLAERIISSRAALEGERKQVTVLFADLKGSMELLADRDPEEARAILDPVLERMMEAAHRYEGTVNQVLGDGIMALFGAPLSHEDHAVRACYAALRMQDTVKAYADEVFRRQGVRVQIRVGLNSGEVVVRSIGSDLRMDYTAVGQTTHLAARMEQTALPGSVLLAPGTLHLAEGYVQVKALGPVPIKGLEEPIDVYELISAGTARTRLQAAAARGLTKFVGRDTELDTLRRALELAGASHGQIVALVGEPGVGKSRLVWEFSHSHRTQGWLVLESGSVSYGQATSYLPIIDLVKSYCGLEDRDDARRIREKLTGKLLTLDPALQPLLGPLLALLDVPVEDPQWQALDPLQRRQRTLDACKRLLLRESQEQPVLLVFEDLHWIDAATQALLDSLVESLPTARILLLVNYRPEYEHTWHRKTYYQQLRLDPLPPASAEELLAALLGEAEALQPLQHLLVERTEGNPFFIEESVRTLVEAGVLTGERGRYHLAKPLDSTQVPTTVQAVLAARIDRLPPEDKRLLQAAAVVGKDVPYPLLEAIAELAEDALRRGLVRLQTAEFLYETSLFPDLEYTFKHALTHEVAYGSLLQDRRRSLHRQIVETIERLYPDRLPEHSERLAHHAFRGEEWGKAVAYLRQAGAKAFARSVNREAVAYYEQAVTALTHFPETRPTLEQGIDVRFDLRNALYPLAEFGRIEGYLREAEILARTLDDQRRLGWVLSYLSGHLMHTGGSATEELTLAQSVQAIGNTLGDVPLQVAAQYYLLITAHLSGDYRGTEHLCQSLILSLQGERARERFGLAIFPAVMCRAWLARALAERGLFDEGDAHGREALRIAEALDHPFSIVFASLYLAYLEGVRGNLARAVPLLERAMAQCQDLNIRFGTPIAMGSLGDVYARSGRIEEGIAWLQQAMAAYESSGIGYLQAVSVVQLGEAYLLAKQVEDAHVSADRAVMLARKRGERGHEAWALRLLGEIASHRDPLDVEVAESHYRQALTLAQELGMRPLVAHCYLGLGTLYRKIGRDKQAGAELNAAAEMYSSMEMTFWLERAEAGLREVGG